VAIQGTRASVPDGREHRYTGGYTTQTHGSHRGSGIDAIQLEFGTDLRSRRNLARTANDLAHAVEIFAREYLPLATHADRGFLAQGNDAQGSFYAARL
jgi:hypothetical protein